MNPVKITEPDVIIVGGGSAGCVLASQLSENPALKIVLLEAGLDAARPEDFPISPAPIPAAPIPTQPTPGPGSRPLCPTAAQTTRRAARPAMSRRAS